MDIHSVATIRGWHWLAEGFRIFRKQPLTWIALIIVMALIWSVALIVPVVGPFIFSLLSPLFFGGLMLACQSTARDQEPSFRQLFAPFHTHAHALMTLGGISLISNIVIISLINDPSLTNFLNKPDDETLKRAALPHALLGCLALLPILLATWFAPLLVIFKNIPPLAALKWSLLACLRNSLPMIVYSCAAMLLIVIATIPLGLGFFVLLPVLVCSIYASYLDIFPEVAVELTKDTSPPSDPPENR